MDKNNFVSRNIFSITIILILLLVISSASGLAFSDYEKNVAEQLYNDLDQKYVITEFKPETTEYQTLKRLEANIINKKFRNEKFKLHHIDDKLINAYYIGNGNIMIFEGLLQQLKTEDQLAALIAHEMGHAVKEHLTEDLQRNMSLSILNLLFNHFTENEYQTMTNIAQNLIANGYSREQEQESDIYAVDLMMRSIYDPEGLIELMKIFKENSHNLKLLEFTQTHPIPESRIKYLNEYIAKKKSQETAENVEDSGANSKTELSQNKPAENAGTERKAVNLNQNFQGKKIKFSYPKSWTLKKVDAVKKEVKLKYQIEAAELQGGFVLEDLSQKSFMETARKQFIYASIAAEEAGAEVKKNTIEDNKLDIYQLEVIEDDQLRFEYFISQKNEQQLLHFTFELNNKNQAETRNLIRKLLKTIKFL